MLEEDTHNPLVNMTLTDFANETASESPAPGGSISAYCGAIGASLGSMVANIAHKRGWDDKWKEFSDWAEKGNNLQKYSFRFS